MGENGIFFRKNGEKWEIAQEKWGNMGEIWGNTQRKSERCIGENMLFKHLWRGKLYVA